jgi:hypothetical protein
MPRLRPKYCLSVSSTQPLFPAALEQIGFYGWTPYQIVGLHLGAMEYEKYQHLNAQELRHLHFYIIIYLF